MPAKGPSPAVLQAAKINGVRLTAKNTDLNKNYISAALAADLTVLAIVATADSDLVPADTRVILQIGNEPDNAAGTYLTPSEYADVWATWRGTYPGYVMFMAGLVSGDPTYYGDFLSALATNHSNTPLPDAVAIHPYGKHASELAGFIALYTAYNPSIPAVVTEWQPFPEDSELVPFQELLGDPAHPNGVAVTWNSWFPWCTAMNPNIDIPGIVNAGGVSERVCPILIGYLGGSCPS